MDDVKDDAKVEFRRIELLTGPSRRRRWSAEAKARIVAETLAPEARVSDVARRWQVCPQQVFGWRRAARVDSAATAVSPGDPAAVNFVPIVTGALPGSAPRPANEPSIEIELAGAVVRVGSGLDDAKRLTAVLWAVRASASRA